MSLRFRNKSFTLSGMDKSSITESPDPPDQPPLDCPDCPGQLTLQLNPWRGGPWIYLCENRPRCRGLMSAHPDGTPQGIPADAATRRARRRVHALVDLIWKQAPLTAYESLTPDRDSVRAIRRAMRRRLYAWIGDQLGLSEPECHISMMDVPTLRRVWTVVQGLQREHGLRAAAVVRQWAKERGL